MPEGSSVKLHQRSREAELGWPGDAGRCHFYRVQLAIETAVPEIEEPAQHRELRCHVEVLPDIALQQRRVIGQVVEDFSRREAIAVGLEDECRHDRRLSACTSWSNNPTGWRLQFN